MTTLERLQEVFRRVFDNKELVISRETSSFDIPGWDSLAQINIVWGAEEAFGVSFEIEEIIGMKNVGDMVELIDSKIGE